MRKAVHVTGGLWGYADAFDGVQTNVRSDIKAFCDTVFVWGPSWDSFEPREGVWTAGRYRPRAYQLDRLAAVFRTVAEANQDGLDVAMPWLNPYPLKGVNAAWTAGDPATGGPADLTPCGPWGTLLANVIGWFDGTTTWGEIRALADAADSVFDSASVAAADALGIAPGATARAAFQIPWGECNASNPADNQKPGITDPKTMALMMQVAAGIALTLQQQGKRPGMLLGPALLDGPPHSVEWGSGARLIPAGVKGYVQYETDGYDYRKTLLRDSIADPRANNTVVPGYAWDQYAIHVLQALAGWRPPVPFGWAHHAYSDLSSGATIHGTTEGLSRLLAKYGWHDVAGGRGRVYLTEECFQGWNDRGAVRGAPGVYDLQLANVRGHFNWARRVGYVEMWTHFLMVDSVRYPADGSVAWLALQAPPTAAGLPMVRHPLYDWFRSFRA